MPWGLMNKSVRPNTNGTPAQQLLELAPPRGTLPQGKAHQQHRPVFLHLPQHSASEVPWWIAPAAQGPPIQMEGIPPTPLIPHPTPVMGQLVIEERGGQVDLGSKSKMSAYTLEDLWLQFVVAWVQFVVIS